MLLSMTGFGGAIVRQNGVTVFVEIKTVNNRYLKVLLRVTEGYAAIEPSIENLVRDALLRGSVNVNVRIMKEGTASDYEINEAALAGYVDQLRAVCAKLGISETFPVAQLLILPGITREQVPTEDKAEVVWPMVEDAVKQAIANLQVMRQKEGTLMVDDLQENSRILAETVDRIEAYVPGVVEQYRVKLTERVGKVMAEHNLAIEPADLVREVALFVDRSDISEEIVRFRSHIAQFNAAMTEKKPKDGCGRRLDFLTQELFREVNTIGSKANDAQITKHVVELKAVIERIREMVQNVE